VTVPSDAELIQRLDAFVRWHANRIAKKARRFDWFDDIYAEGLLAMIAAARKANWAARNPWGYVRAWIKGYQHNWVQRQLPGVRDQHHKLIDRAVFVPLAEADRVLKGHI
jgi:hypothetical protein